MAFWTCLDISNCMSGLQPPPPQTKKKLTLAGLKAANRKEYNVSFVLINSGQSVYHQSSELEPCSTGHKAQVFFFLSPHNLLLICQLYRLYM